MLIIHENLSKYVTKSILCCNMLELKENKTKVDPNNKQQTIIRK